MKTYPVPTEPGLYWAKSGNFEWFNLIVEVMGDAPFFQMNVWNRSPLDGRFLKDFRSYNDIKAWGPVIVMPE